MPGAAADDAAASADILSTELYLEVYINGVSTSLVAQVLQESDGRLLMPADQLKGVGLLPESAAVTPDGLVWIDRLPGTEYRFDSETQSLHFEAVDEARVRKRLDAGGKAREQPALQSGFGGVLNYSLFANLSGDEAFVLPVYRGVTGSFDTRIFSPMGILEHSFIATTSPTETYDSTRLATTWSYSDPKNLVTYRAGDIISGGLTWTRPVRLGGVQMQRAFRLRPDLVTTPVPELTGTAAVPSTVEVYANNIRRFSGDVQAGPFELSNVPLISGPGTVRIVVRDEFGRETVEEVPFYSSPRMLAPGLLDFSFDAGVARRGFGLSDDSYDDRLMASASLRYGLTPRLTVEGHIEGGEQLVMGGAAALFNLGTFGLGTINGAVSHHDGASGFQLGGSVEAAWRGWRLFAGSQRTFGDYSDIASVTARFDPDLPFRTGRAPEAVDQISISPPAFSDGSTFNLNFAHVKDFDVAATSVLGLSYSRPLFGNSTLYAHGYADLDGDSYGAFVGFSRPLGKISASTALRSDGQGARVATSLVRHLDPQPWSVGWHLRDIEGDLTERSAGASVRTPVAKLEATVRQFESSNAVTAQASGSVAAIGGGVFFAERISDAFVVVDAGVPGVDVRYQNRFVGKTDRRGKLLIPGFRSLREGSIKIDPTNLPVDVDVPSARETLAVAEKSGAVVKFGASADAGAALVTLRGADGAFLPAGAEGRLIGSEESFLVGYDGETYIRGLASKNRIEVLIDDDLVCRAEFPFQARAGEQVSIPDVSCL